MNRGEPAEVAYIGGVAHYAIADAGFKRHVEALKIDNEVIASIKAQTLPNQGEMVRTMMKMLGKDDIFTKAALDASIRNMETNIRQSDPGQWQPWLQMLGFRVVVDVHGNIVEMIYPTQPGEGEEGEDE